MCLYPWWSSVLSLGLPRIGFGPTAVLLFSSSALPIRVNHEFARDPSTRIARHRDAQSPRVENVHEVAVHDLNEPFVGDVLVPKPEEVLLQGPKIDDAATRVDQDPQGHEIGLLGKSEKRDLRALDFVFHGILARIRIGHEKRRIAPLLLFLGHDLSLSIQPGNGGLLKKSSGSMVADGVRTRQEIF